MHQSYKVQTNVNQHWFGRSKLNGCFLNVFYLLRSGVHNCHCFPDLKYLKMVKELITYKNDKELDEIFTKEFQESFAKARESNTNAEEFKMQQSVYSKFSEVYDEAMRIEKYSGPQHISEKVNSFFESEKDINILDFGCGSGLVADHLIKFGFKNVDGLDCNQELLGVAKKKNLMREYILSKDTVGLKTMSSNTYHVVCASGVFFLTPTHPGMDCFPELCRIIHPGGYLIILTKNTYLDCDYVEYSIVNDLEKKGIVKSFPKETYQGYRQTYEFEEDRKSMAAILVYKIL